MIIKLLGVAFRGCSYFYISPGHTTLGVIRPLISAERSKINYRCTPNCEFCVYDSICIFGFYNT